MPFTITGTLTAGSSAITSASSTTSLAVGMLIDNANVVAGTTISAIQTSPAAITMSAPASGSGTGETIDFVSSFAAAVATAVTVAVAPLVIDTVLEEDAVVSVSATADLNPAGNQQLFTDGDVVIVATADLQSGRSELLESLAPFITVTVSANLEDQNVRMETSASVSASAAAELSLSGRPLFDAIELYLDVTARKLVTLRSGSAAAAASKILLKRGDTPLLRVRFVRNDAVCDIESTSVVKVGAKQKGNYGGTALFTTPAMTRYLDDARLPFYEQTVSLAATPVTALFAGDTISKVDCIGEIEVSTPSLSSVASSQEFPIEMWNDIIR